MLRGLAAYVLVFFLAPTVGALIDLISIPVRLAIPNVKQDKPGVQSLDWGYGLLTGLFSIGSGFVAIWFSRFVFVWLGVKPTVTVAWVLGMAYVANDFRRVWFSPTPLILPRVCRAFGDLLGIMLGALYLLQ